VQELSLKYLKNKMKAQWMTDYSNAHATNMETRYYVSLPGITDHQGHPVDNVV